MSCIGISVAAASEANTRSLVASSHSWDAWSSCSSFSAFKPAAVYVMDTKAVAGQQYLLQQPSLEALVEITSVFPVAHGAGACEG